MVGLDDLWSRFSLIEEEEGGAEVPRQVEEVVHQLASRFSTKKILNVDAVACTFKSLWKPIGEYMIRDIRENILAFEFKDSLDLEQVLEFKPWSYDKHIVALQRDL